MLDQQIQSQSRRGFLKVAGTIAGSGLIWPWGESAGFGQTVAEVVSSPNDRPKIGSIGLGGRGTGIAQGASRLGDIVAVCDVDRQHAESAAKRFKKGDGSVAIFEDYRQLLDRNDIELVTIGTPDHWHTRIAIAALRAGKHVYCEKPLTLTIDEGKQIRKVVEETKRVFQVGTQQRSEFNNRFLTAVALIREGRLGKVKRVTCAIGGAPAGNQWTKETAPTHLNWNLWQGQTPTTDYIKQRTHNDFRWWYEYSGGKMTDWGAHHVDIAQWAIGMENSGPSKIEVGMVKHPQELKKGMPTNDSRFNTATDFLVKCHFSNNVEVIIRHDTENGVRFEGEKGELFVSRGKLAGSIVDDLKKNPLDPKIFTDLRKGKPLSSHMANFFECCRDGSTPVSDVATHHRSLTTCHLANIAIRLNRSIQWDPTEEQIVGDQEANSWLSRDQRKGFETQG